MDPPTVPETAAPAAACSIQQPTAADRLGPPTALELSSCGTRFPPELALRSPPRARVTGPPHSPPTGLTWPRSSAP